jgi:hypothetical protein
MTQEEKAKRYEEALERANIIYTDEYKPEIAEFCKQSLENIFPELKESEDERIRKAILEGLIDCRVAPDLGWSNFGGIEIDDCIAWLEKQGDKPQGKIPLEAINNIDDKGYCCVVTSQDKSALEAINEEKVDNQNCVKPADEPKFHEGECLTENHPNNYARFVQILEIVNVQGKKRYRISRDLHNDEDIVECRFIEDNWHHFNIHDAKDGDVLFHSDSASNGIFIFKEILQCRNMQKVICYCDYDSEDGFCLGENHTCCWTDSKILHPATKKQRDLLFQKMKEAGYEWTRQRKN